MSAATLALWLTLALVALALVPTAWVLGREAFRRVATKKALKKVEEARKVLGEGQAADVEALGKALAERFDAITTERALLQLLRAEDPALRAWGSRLFGQLGLVERYAARVREAPKWSERTHAAEVLGLAALPAAVPALVGALRDRYEDDASVKVAAAASLAKLRDPTAIPLLVKELLDVDERSSRNVAEALVAFGALAVPALLELLVDAAHPTARVWAARILGRIGDTRATDDLVARLHDRDDLLRMAAAEALGAIGEGRALQPLVRATLRDPAPQVRAHAAGAVAKIEGERAIDVLVAALSDNDYATRIRALEAFETMRIEDTSPLESALRDPNGEVRRRAALALERVGYLERVIGKLTDADAEARAHAYAALLELGRVGLTDSIASYVHHASFEVRAIAAKACGELGSARTAPLVMVALEDVEWPVRASACEALGRMRVEKAADALVQRLTDAEEPVREAAAEGLTNYPPQDLAAHVDALAAAYDKGTVAIRTHVVVLADRIGGPKTDELLVRASADPSDGVRLRAVSALGGRPGEVMVEPLIARLTDASLDVRMAAVAALGSAATTEAFEGLLRALGGATPEVRDRIAEALARGAREAIFTRLEELERGALDVRLGIAWTLGKIGDAAAVPTLARFLRDADAGLRASAAGALAKIATPRAKEALLAAAEDPDGRVRAAVVNALARGYKEDERVLEALARRARDPDAFVRNRALVALARTGGAEVHAKIVELADGADEAARLVAFALVGTPTALARVIDALAAAGTFDRIFAFLDREDPRRESGLRAAFFAALHLEDPAARGEATIDVNALLAQYEQVLRTSLDVEARSLAVAALARLRADRAIEILADALSGDPSETVRLEAAQALSPHASDRAARRALARAVSDPNSEVALHAISAIAGRKEPEVAQALAKRLGAGAPEVQEAVERALADLHRDEPFGFLDWMMGVDVPELLAPSIRVLARMAQPATLPLLQELVGSHSALVRAETVRALGTLATPDAAMTIDELVQDPSEDVRIAVLDVIMMSGDALLRIAPLRRDPSVRVRARAATALERVDASSTKSAIKLLEATLSDAAPEVRAAALASLAASPDADGLRAFGRAWEKTALDARMAMRSEPRAQAITDQMAVRLASSPDPVVRRPAAAAIGAFGVDGAHEHVVPALRDPSPEVRIAAVQALAPIDEPDVRRRLSEMLADPDAAVRDAARRSIVRTVG